MRPTLAIGLVLALIPGAVLAADKTPAPLPKVAEDWSVELVTQAPEILFPTAIVAAPDGTIYLGQDPMDMPGPPTRPIDSIVAIKDGKVSVFAEGLWAVMGLEWADGTLYVVHAPYLSALRDTNGDGKADQRLDLITGLGPKLPGFNGINDHVASGVRLGMDGFLYISVGDKGIPKGVGKDGTTIQLYGGGVIRVRTDGTGLEVVSTGERNPLSVALSDTDEVFTYGNDDDSKKWPNSLTHHIVGGHYGYPYQFLTAPWRTLPIMAGQIGGSGAQGICYNEDGLPAPYRGDLFFCDWGLQTVFRYKLEPAGGTFAVKEKTSFVSKGDVADFRPFSLGVAGDGASLLLVDWAFDGWLADGPKTGRLYRLSYTGADKVTPAPRPAGNDPAARLAALDHPARSVRLESQRRLSGVGPLVARLRKEDAGPGRLHALWALDTLGTPDARQAIRTALTDPEAQVRLQAARSVGQRRDRVALATVAALVRDSDAAVRREAAIALGKLGDPSAGPALYAALGDPDAFAAWAIRGSIRTLRAWDEKALVVALLDPKRRDNALTLCDESWEIPVASALSQALAKTDAAPVRARIVGALAGLYKRYPAWSGHWFGTNPLAGQMPQKTESWQPAGMAVVVAGLTQALNDLDPDVRFQTIAGLRAVGKEAAPRLRTQLASEGNERNLIALIQALGAMGDRGAVTSLVSLVQDPRRPEAVRAPALDALALLGGPEALRARLVVVYEPKAPVKLVARALAQLGREGALPPNDAAGFLENPAPEVRGAALAALHTRKQVPAEVKQAALAMLDDPALPVRQAALELVAPLHLTAAVPRLLTAALDETTRTEATLALCALPDTRALPVYLAAIRDRSPALRQAGESALLAIRDAVAGDLEHEARSGRLSGPAALAVERVLTRFTPLIDWHVIGPFPRTTAKLFVNESSIDFGKTHTGAEGRTVAWTTRKGEPLTGRIILDDFKAGSGDRGGFGYDTNGSPDLCAFGAAEFESDSDRPALLLVGSSGTIAVILNGKPVLTYQNFAGRSYAPDANLARVDLKQGRNRVLAIVRQGIGVWSFSVQFSAPSAAASLFAAKPAALSIDELRAFALSRPGDARKGEDLFFDPKGIGCVKCHAAGGRGDGKVGPDLTGLALKYDKAEIIRSVLEPSNRIATGFQPVIVALHDGKVLTGLIRSETAATLELVDADAKVIALPQDQIDERRVGDVSLMPAGQVETLTPLEFTDLISYLLSLKSQSR